MALWDTGWYEARMTAAFLGEPERLTSAEMDRWCGDFDNWAVCDHACFHLFDKSRHAWSKVMSWQSTSRRVPEAGRLCAAGIAGAARQRGA